MEDVCNIFNHKNNFFLKKMRKCTTDFCFSKNALTHLCGCLNVGPFRQKRKKVKENALACFRKFKSLGFECVSKSGPESASVLILSKIGSLKLDNFRCVRDSTPFKVFSYLINV